MLALTDDELARLLRDDVPFGDLTTDSLGIGDQAGRIEFRARGAMTACATEEAARMLALAGATAECLMPSGATVTADTLLLRAEGTATSLHTAWKAAQILLEWASGIASATRAIVDAATPVPVACTRKATPGAKALAIKAVRAGGAVMHRLGLSESLLIFAEHRLFLDAAPADTIGRLRRSQPEKKIAIEVATPEEALIWCRAGADVLQLEKFTPAQVAATRAAVAGMPILLAAAGGVRADNAAAYVAAGADLLVTSAPYWAPPRDVQVLFARGS
jgi:molybdenum transport protein